MKNEDPWKAAGWREIESFDRPDGEKVSALSLVYSTLRAGNERDGFTIPGGVWREDGKWLRQEGGKVVEVGVPLRYWRPLT